MPWTLWPACGCHQYACVLLPDPGTPMSRARVRTARRELPTRGRESANPERKVSVWCRYLCLGGNLSSAFLTASLMFLSR